jgi:hypothetical protein
MKPTIRNTTLAALAAAGITALAAAPANAQDSQPLTPLQPQPPQELQPQPQPLTPLQPQPQPRQVEPIPGPPPRRKQGTKRSQITVMSYNINSLGKVLGIIPPLHYPSGFSNGVRDAAVAKWLRSLSQNDRPDVIVIDEAFDSDALNMADSLSDLYPYQTDVVGRVCDPDDGKDKKKRWNGTYGACHDELAYIRGGTMILSKYNIREKWQYIYRNSTSAFADVGSARWDHFSNKGVALVAIDAPNGGVVWVAGTHLQSGDTLQSGSTYHYLENIRRMQLGEMVDFIKMRSNWTKEPVLMAGDLNIPIYLDGLSGAGGRMPIPVGDTQAYPNLFTSLKVEDGGSGVSVDCQANRIACDSQGEAYDPKDYQDSLDYVGYMSGTSAAKPVDMTKPKTWQNTVLQYRGNKFAPSDHFPVSSTFTLDLQAGKQRVRRNARQRARR